MSMADNGWAYSFIEEERELATLDEESDEYIDLVDSMSDQWTEMNEDTRKLIIKLREQKDEAQ